MCDANSSEMVNGLPVKEESEVSLIEDRSREVKETGNGDALFETKEVEDVTIKEEYPYDEEHMVIVDPLLTFQCKHCKKVFTTQCDLDFHMKEKHTEAKLLSCTMCSETFLEESDLMMHAKFHNHGNPCIIKVCKRIFLLTDCCWVHALSILVLPRQFYTKMAPQVISY